MPIPQNIQRWLQSLRAEEISRVNKYNIDYKHHKCQWRGWRVEKIIHPAGGSSQQQYFLQTSRLSESYNLTLMESNTTSHKLHRHNSQLKPGRTRRASLPCACAAHPHWGCAHTRCPFPASLLHTGLKISWERSEGGGRWVTFTRSDSSRIRGDGARR